MFNDVIVTENDFLSMVERHTGGTIRSAWLERGTIVPILQIRFAEKELNDNLVGRYGFAYDMEQGLLEWSKLDYGNARAPYSLWRMYEAEHPHVTVVGVSRNFGGGFVVKVRTKD